MNIHELMQHLRQKNIAVEVDNGELVIKAAPGVIDAALLAVLKSNKKELTAILVPSAPRIVPEMLNLVKLKQYEIDAIVAKVPDGAAGVQDIYPLGPLQEGILFHHLLDNETDTYLLRTALRFDTRTHVDRFLSALQHVVDRHDILRSSVHWEGLERAVQVVHRQAPIKVREIAFDTAVDTHAQLMDMTDHLRLDLSRAPLLVPFIAADQDSPAWYMVL
ncbi:condensation domain-containing protein, partial [Massilia aurea]